MADLDEGGGRGGFEGALDQWASAHQGGITAVANFVSGLEEFAGSQRR